MEKIFDKALQAKLHEIFRFAIELIEKKGLSYWTCGGTTLGAVRHKNIIPWDDDIDIYMPREDYEKLMADRQELLGTKYRLFTLGDKGYSSPFAKLVDINTSWWETKKVPLVLGVFVDIFPLDFFDWSKEMITKEQYKSSRLYYRYYYTLCNFSHEEYWALFKGFHFGDLYRKLSAKLYSSEKALRLLLEQEKKMAKANGHKYCVCFTQWEGRIFDAEWFDGYTSCDFNDYSVRNPKNSDSYLKLLYGDYMKLPPEDKRVSQHNQFYVNLKEHLSVEEILNRLEKGEQNIIY